MSSQGSLPSWWGDPLASEPGGNTQLRFKQDAPNAGLCAREAQRWSIFHHYAGPLKGDDQGEVLEPTVDLARQTDAPRSPAKSPARSVGRSPGKSEHRISVVYCTTLQCMHKVPLLHRAQLKYAAHVDTAGSVGGSVGSFGDWRGSANTSVGVPPTGTLLPSSHTTQAGAVSVRRLRLRFLSAAVHTCLHMR